MLEKLSRSLLGPKHVKALRLEPMTEEMALKAKLDRPWAGFKIPYFKPDGSIDPTFYRYRFWPEARPSKGWASVASPSEQRYTQAGGSPPRVYMPPLLRDVTWNDVMQYTQTVVDITEGELKAACGCSQGRFMLGLGGVFNWTSKKLHQPLIPELEAFDWTERRVNIVFDSDKSSKPLVRLAASRLATTLVARGAVVYDVDLTSGPDGTKRGVDDFIAADGIAAYEALVDNTQPVQESLELHKLNGEVAVIWSGGGPAGNVVRFEDGLIMKPAQFTRALYKDRVYLKYHVNAKGEAAAPRVAQAADEWLGWACRSRVNRITYAPGASQITADGDYNMWRGWGVEPIKGDIGPWERLFAHVARGLEPAHAMWLRRWFAWPLRNPGSKMFSCVLVWSHKGGTGKNLLAETFKPIYGDNYTMITNKDLTSGFNGWAEARQFIVGDEIALDDKRHTSGDLKSTLTSRTVRVNRKGIEAYEVPDCTNFFLTSNDPMALSLDQGERRTFVIHAPETPYGNAAGTAFKDWLLAGGAAHVFHYLTVELSMGDFSPTAEPPDTNFKLDMIANSRTDVDTWAADLQLDPTAILMPVHGKYAGQNGAMPSVWTSADLLKAYDPDDRKRGTLRTMGIALDRAGFTKATHNNGRLGNVRSTFWLIGRDVAGKQISSVVAAEMYKAERPEQFKRPSEKAKEQRRPQ